MPQNQDSLELLLSRVAITTIGDKDPRLMESYVGTDIIEKNDTQSKVFAVSIFRIGPYRIYIPVFFINSKVEPVESMFIENVKRFVPLTSDWVSYILNGANQTARLGSTVDQSDVIDRYDTSSGSNFSRFEVLPFLSKDSMNIKTLPETAVTDILKEACPEQLGALLRMLEDEGFSKTAQQYWDIDKVKNTLKEGFEKASKKLEEKVTKKPKADKPSKVLESPVELLPESDDTKSNFYADGFAVVDTNKNPSLVLKQDEIVQNPISDGYYTCIMASGDLVECVVMECPGVLQSNDRNSVELYVAKDELSNKYLVIDPKSKQWCITAPSNIFIYGESDDDEFVKKVSKISKSIKITNFKVEPEYVQNKPEPKEKKRYVILDKDDNDNVKAKLIFDVKNKKTNPKKDQVIVGNLVTGSEWFSRSKKIRIYLSSKANELVVNEDNKNQHGGYSYDESASVIVNENYPCIELTVKMNGGSELDLGNSATFFDKLYREGGFEKIMVSGDGISYKINEKSKEMYLDKKAALRYLIDEKGMTSEDSYSTLICADYKPESELIIKTSGSFPTSARIPERRFTNNSSVLGMNMPSVSSEPENDALPMTYADYRFTPDKNSLPQNEENYRATPERKQELARLTRTDIDDAMRASELGNKNIFDYSVIGSLAKYTNVNEKISEYIKTFEVALNDLGEILFMFQWKGGDLVDSFGTFELKDMEDLLKTVFRNFGDLLLKLKNKQRILEKTQDIA